MRSIYSMYTFFIKRLLDITVSLSVLIVLSPIFLLLTLFLLISNQGAGVFFTQDRPGKDAKIFKVIKFKTMTDECDDNGDLLPDQNRITEIGKFVRSASLDEMPQLLNVLKGDMSLVGPRPLLVKYLPLYNDYQSKRHNVKPGITGWAQVNGRNAISWEKKFELDVWYVKHISFLTDIKVILLTIKKVFIKEGINSSASATMETFTGTKNNEIT